MGKLKTLYISLRFDRVPDCNLLFNYKVYLCLINFAHIEVIGLSQNHPPKSSRCFGRACFLGCEEKMLITENINCNIIHVVPFYCEQENFPFEILDIFWPLMGNIYFICFHCQKYMPQLAAIFSHVIVDVSSIMALCIRWYPKGKLNFMAMN
jgi:hypothetical protein